VSKYITTIGVDYGVKKISINNKKVAVNFFDLSGSNDYEEIRNPFFIDSQVVLLIFDLENKQSFQNLARWENLMKSNGLDLKQCTVFILGNKCDAKGKEVDASEAIVYAKKRGYEYFQTSASTGENINEVFEKAFTKAVQQMEEKKKKYT
jgi:DnaJ family protein C protein 27